jgi:hypothetical protein
MYMRMSNFLIGKPGPGSLSEALHMRLPVIVERNAWTLPQERFNTDWVRENGFGIVVKSFRDIVPAVDQNAPPGFLCEMPGDRLLVRGPSRLRDPGHPRPHPGHVARGSVGGARAEVTRAERVRRPEDVRPFLAGPPRS